MEEVESGGKVKYNIVIDNFEGPFDLLCFLISKNKMDIFEVPLSEITDKYLEYLQNMQELDMEIATEFLVMASTLLYLKSKKLLPVAEPVEETEEIMSEEELMSRLIKYKQYKEKQPILREMYENNFGSFEKLPEKIKFKRQIDFSKLFNIEDLQILYNTVLLRNKDKINAKAEDVERIAIYEKVTVKSKVKQIVEIFKKKTKFVFNKVFNKKENKNIDIVTAFLSILELSRLKNVKITQEEMFGDILVEKCGNSEIDISMIDE